MGVNYEQYLQKQREEILQKLDEIKELACEDLHPVVAESLDYRCENKLKSVKRGMFQRKPKISYNMNYIVHNFKNYVSEQRRRVVQKYGAASFLENHKKEQYNEKS